MSATKKNAIAMAVLLVVGLALTIGIGIFEYHHGVVADETGTSGQIGISSWVGMCVGVVAIIVGLVFLVRTFTPVPEAHRPES